MQCFLGAFIHALETQYTIRPVDTLPGVVNHIHIHGTNLAAFVARYAFFLFVFYAKQRKIACGFQKYCNRADIFAKCPVVLEAESENDSR